MKSRFQIPEIEMADYRYDLPDELIAQKPSIRRDGSRLLLYRNGNVEDRAFDDIPSLIPEGSFMVFNNSRVIKARLIFRKATGATIEIFCLEPVMPADYEEALSSKNFTEWKCIAGNLRKWKSGSIGTTATIDGKKINLTAERVADDGGEITVRFSWSGGNTFREVLESAGHTPLPPYISRPDDENDSERYQTVYSEVDGSVAAPTAGLHFTNAILEKIRTRGIGTGAITLHVGAGTFQPVKGEYISTHTMHTEHYSFTAGLLENLLANSGKVIATGTTSLRALESIYWLGVKVLSGEIKSIGEFHTAQWEPYSGSTEASTEKSLESLLAFMSKNRLESVAGSTSIIIVPGYRFRVVRGLVTNFHQPGSTLLLLVSAFTGKDWKKIYEHAINSRYRFLSYGDSSFLLPH